MLYKASAAAVVLSIALVVAGCGDWAGFGFRGEGRDMDRLASVLALHPGMVVADVGAGKGELTMGLARRVGPSGRVFSTDLEPRRVERLRTMVAEASLNHVTVVAAQERATGLPPGCCDAIVMRRVFHHFSDPSGMSTSALETLRSGGMLVVIDFPPPFFWRHGVPAQTVIDAVKRSGFELVSLISDWPGRGPLESYCAVFRKPSAGTGAG